MGLGFLLAEHEQRRYRITYSGEVNPIYVNTLKANHAAFAAQHLGKRSSDVPSIVAPVDLREPRNLESLADATAHNGGVHVLIGGPPCQGFSNANRNSWASSNPHNKLVEVFLAYLERLSPPIFVMENVQGILWTPKRGANSQGFSVVDYLAKRMERAGYELFPRLLDAVWYGVPQHRCRFFLLGIRRDLGYRPDDFGDWGPFPRPTHGPGTPRAYVSVREAIGDLPRISNGAGRARIPYDEPTEAEFSSNQFLAQMRREAESGVILDHIASRHADYVLERYRRIPQGGNWESIKDAFTNYADVDRTHSNIYRRLKWTEPSVTIGHYRKSMLVHPSQTRGLSLREASRLQSFPDWFQFAGASNGGLGGLAHKQQQLANAVCPLVSKAVAEFLLEL